MGGNTEWHGFRARFILGGPQEVPPMTRESKTEHAIPVRTPDLRFDAPMPLLWLRDNAYLTFLFNGFNLTFPQGERHFVRAVHDHLPLITDPTLREQIRGFSGQEGQHARIHERVFDALRAQGFDLDPFFLRYDRYVKTVAERPAALRLAATAALEHYTATLAQLVFMPGFMDGVHEPMRQLLVWHAAEELEHRAVAFDVLRAAHPGYALRALGFLMGSASVFHWIAIGMRLFIQQSDVPARRVWRDFLATGRLIPAGPLALALLAYLRPGFHPNQTGSIEAALAQLRADGLDIAPTAAA
jgi:predicted metal-dependent hydrolase